MKMDIITNLTEEELKTELDSFVEVCEQCKFVHKEFRMATPCYDCKNSKIVNGLKRHFKNM